MNEPSQDAGLSGDHGANFLRAIDRINPYVKLSSFKRYYIDIRNPQHIGVTAVEYEAMKRLIERTNELLDNRLLELEGGQLRLASGKLLDDTFLLKSEFWFRR
jgi:hypothetical protein